MVYRDFGWLYLPSVTLWNLIGLRPFLPAFGLLAVISCAPLAFAGDSHSGHGTHNHSHDHAMLEVLSDKVPTVELKVEKDKVSGWNIFITTQNFTFTPEQVNGPAIQNQGHAHLYVNGKKAGRIYGSHYHLESMPAGKNDVRVTLNADNHAAFAFNGKAIEATAQVEVPTH
ncbi:MAG: hypothetical protein AAGA53_05580 [Pseudomonadota bacterium]